MAEVPIINVLLKADPTRLREALEAELRRFGLSPRRAPAPNGQTDDIPDPVADACQATLGTLADIMGNPNQPAWDRVWAADVYLTWLEKRWVRECL